MTASVILIILFVVMSLYMYVLAAVVTMPQFWLQNLAGTCEMEFETDSEGNLVPDMEFFFIEHILSFTFYFAILGFYFGQLWLSYRCYDIPAIDTFVSCGSFLRRVFISLCGVVISSLPALIAQ